MARTPILHNPWWWLAWMIWDGLHVFVARTTFGVAFYVVALSIASALFGAYAEERWG